MVNLLKKNEFRRRLSCRGRLLHWGLLPAIPVL